MVTIKTRKGSVYETLKTLFNDDFKPEPGYPMRIPLIGNHVTINHSRFYWDWESVHADNKEEAILDLSYNIIFIEVNGERRVAIDTKDVKRLWISVKGGLFQKDDYTETYFLYFGAEEKDFH